MVNYIAIPVMTVMALAVPHISDWSPSQVEGWEGYDREGGIIVYCYTAVTMAVLGLLLHFGYHMAVASSVTAASKFTQMILSFFFVYNYAYIYLYGVPTPLSIGVQSGACAGYELYGLLTEIIMWLNGQKRVDMLFHHLTCCIFTSATLAVYCHVSLSDLYFWHIIWDSISRMLASNVPLNFRYFSKGTFGNTLFFIGFLWVRWIEQIPFVGRVYNSYIDGSLMQIESYSTMAVVASWLILCLLNFYWGLLLIQIALGLKGERKSKSKNE
eukprot:TRINITY_DN2665_c3_g1_i1.p1 TRINITY_DN2665_c3_g1~~TRINITY_DN2665_c3_g1_i1.p1  ORF type:complete len:270 (+),score=28.99 TRINITY_DN2665_c3_g1_i1:58-867(+)